MLMSSPEFESTIQELEKSALSLDRVEEEITRIAEADLD